MVLLLPSFYLLGDVVSLIVYSGVLLKRESFIKMRSACFARSFLQKEEYWSEDGIGSFYFYEKILTLIGHYSVGTH